MIHFSIDWVLILGPLIGIVLPLLVAIVTKTSTNGGIKAILLAALALVTNLLTGIDDALTRHVDYNLGQALVLGLGTFVIAVAVHYGLFAPTGVSATLQEKVGSKDAHL